MAKLRPEASSLPPSFSSAGEEENTKIPLQIHSCIQEQGFHLPVPGRDTGEGEQAKSNINVGAVSVTLGLKGNESDGKEIFQTGGDRENEVLCWLKGKE